MLFTILDIGSLTRPIVKLNLGTMFHSFKVKNFKKSFLIVINISEGTEWGRKEEEEELLNKLVDPVA